MKYCIRCGKQHTDDLVFCDNCGEFLATYEQYYYMAQYYNQKQIMQSVYPYAYHYARPDNTVQRPATPSAYSQAATPENQPDSKKKRFWKRIGYMTLVAVVVTVILTILEAVGCIDGNWGVPIGPEDGGYSQSSDVSEEIPEEEILNILDSTKVDPMFSPTVGQMIVKVFHTFDITYEKIPGTETEYHVTISGEFCPNPDIPYMTMEGAIKYRVTVSTGRCVLISDINNVEAAFLAHIFY